MDNMKTIGVTAVMIADQTVCQVLIKVFYICLTQPGSKPVRECCRHLHVVAEESEDSVSAVLYSFVFYFGHSGRQLKGFNQGQAIL